MSFPTAGILDDFNRADSSSGIGGSWSPFMRSGYDLGIDNNEAYNPDSEWNAYYYDAAQYGPDCEAFVSFPTLFSQNKGFNLYLRLKDTTVDAWNFDGYAVRLYRWDDGGTDTMILSLSRVDNGAETQLGSSIYITDHGDGDKVGIRAVGTALELWYDDGARWEKRATQSDSSYAAAGYLGFYEYDENSARWDDFGGGNYYVSGNGRLLCINQGVELFYK